MMLCNELKKTRGLHKGHLLPAKRTVHYRAELRQKAWAERCAYAVASRQERRTALDELTTEQRFRRLADEWTRATMHVSSGTDLISHPSYRAIVKLGWPVVPFLLDDLQQKKGFWFTALAEITRLRPFDRSDEGNPRRMTKAWLEWGKRKRFIQPG
jgi:hypothetical protein